MANVRINVFESLPLLANIRAGIMATSISQMKIISMNIPGSISFNNLAMAVSGSGGVSENLSISFGLYSLNGVSLSLANSGSAATGLILNQTMFSWLSFSTSAVQDITPGIWYFAAMSSTTLGGSFSVIANTLNAGNVGLNAAYGGPFFRGKFNTAALPDAIATSDITKEGSGDTTTANYIYPYVLISA